MILNERRNDPYLALFHRIFKYDVVAKQLLGLSRFQNPLFTARRNARIASAVQATAIPSVCLSVRPSVRLSVTHCDRQTVLRQNDGT